MKYTFVLSELRGKIAALRVKLFNKTDSYERSDLLIFTNPLLISNERIKDKFRRK